MTKRKFFSARVFPNVLREDSKGEILNEWCVWFGEDKVYFIFAYLLNGNSLKACAERTCEQRVLNACYRGGNIASGEWYFIMEANIFSENDVIGKSIFRNRD